MEDQFKITWYDAGREPQCAPDPRFPEGIDVDASEEGTGCKTLLPYPARRCGQYHVACNLCGVTVAITTAGRPDDPRSLRLPCKINGNIQ